MAGEIDLKILLSYLAPILQEGIYVFCSVPKDYSPQGEKILAAFLEKEGKTLILPQETADKLQLEYPCLMAWISLDVHSSLEAVGLTAAVSRALAQKNIGSNAIAAYYHDHIFVKKSDAEEAMQVLEELAREARA